MTRVYGYTGAGFNCKEGLGRDPLLTRQSDSFGIPRIEKNRKKKKRKGMGRLEEQDCYGEI